VDDGPTVLRFSKGEAPESVPALRRFGTVDVLSEPRSGEGDLLLVALGAFGELGVSVAERLADQGVGVTVVDPRWVVPVPEELAALSARHRLVATLEDSGRHGGFGSAFAASLRDAGVEMPLLDLAVPQRFLPPGSRAEVLFDVGLSAQDVALRITEWAADRLGDTASASVTPLDLAERRDAS
jgi:1-deoxy-D-xylulose-5-phosphate synthase